MDQANEYGVEIRDIHKTYPATQNNEPVPALQGVSLLVKPGELFVILGPSGCGKSTLLRSVAGLEEPESGNILLGRGEVFNASTGVNIAARDRQVGMVFQNYALYPHMNVQQNISFGLKSRKTPPAETAERTENALRLVEMDGLADRMPAQLSGGQRQRVALARAVAANPRILLFDEPLSNLDVLLRSMLRTELKQLIQRIGTTTLFVTHDQEEAMIIGDRVAVMNKGKVEQIGRPEEVYRLPQTLFVARFTGRPRTNLIEGIVELHENRWILVPIESRAETLMLPQELAEFRGQRITVHARPEDVAIADGESDATALRIAAVQPEGSHTFIHCELGGPYAPLLIRDRSHRLDRSAIGSTLSVRMTRMTVYSADSGYLLKEIHVPEPRSVEPV